ncbi:MAG: hypothetical protein ACTSVK_02155 [Promethearchaeota archaeon]
MPKIDSSELSDISKIENIKKIVYSNIIKLNSLIFKIYNLSQKEVSLILSSLSLLKTYKEDSIAEYTLGNQN